MATVDLPAVVVYLFNMLTTEQKTSVLATVNPAPVDQVPTNGDVSGAPVAPAAGGNKRTRKNKGGDKEDKKNDDKNKNKKRNNK